jgi:hypothetical protein
MGSRRLDIGYYFVVGACLAAEKKGSGAGFHHQKRYHGISLL